MAKNKIDFFDEATEASDVKAKIVSKYFFAWAKIMKSRCEKIGYIDLFSGPGRYKDGKPSTPIRVVESILANKELREMFVLMFNDKDKKRINYLKDEVEKLPNIHLLKHQPTFSNIEVSSDLAKELSGTKLIPNLAFIDPFGYKGLSLELIRGLMKDWGSDCIFFFNYNRIGAGITNGKIEDHIDSIFGKKRAQELRKIINHYKGEAKEHVVINAISEALREQGGNYVLPFQFNTGSRTSHFLIFVTKHPLGYRIMKDIMAKESSNRDDDGIASFSYIPVHDEQLELLFTFSKPLDDLADDLLISFSGKTLTTEKIFERHQINTRFTMKNYKDALKKLEGLGLIDTEPPLNKRPKRDGKVTFADKVIVKFP